MKGYRLNPLEKQEAQESVVRALAEDLGSGDITSAGLLPADLRIRAEIVARKECVVAGIEVAAMAFQQLDQSAVCTHAVPDGERVAPGTRLMRIEGQGLALLAAERTALNFLQRLSGIATLTRRFVEAVRPYGVAILDTRKTTPGLRRLEKYAVRCGGGANHRMGLYDRILIKDNHRWLWGRHRRLADAVRLLRSKYPGVPIEVEVESEDELEDVLEECPDWILFDNMPPERLRACVSRCRGRCRVEASGGITLENIAEIAVTGVDAVSLGCLTHSAPAVDLSLEVLDHP
ncbi:MAG: carboxylating nicotinate-nucleotide diphosphorylase [Kiritimatiellia bacterium]